MDTDGRTTSDADVTWPERIVVGVDDSPEATLALERALELATRGGCAVVVVHAVGLLEGGGYRPDFDVEEMIARANARIGCPPELVAPPVKEVGPPAEVLERIVERVGGDLIVVGRRGAGVAWRPLGSTSEGVLTRTRVPVLVVSH